MDDTTKTAVFPFSDDVADVVGRFAVAAVLEGWAAGRVIYDRYTATSQDSLGAYEVAGIAKQINDEASARLFQLKDKSRPRVGRRG